MKTLNTYQSLAHPTVHKNVTITEWLTQIKSSKYSGLIESARAFTKDDYIYKNIKRSLPCVTFNFTYKNYKIDDNIIASTGLLYIDVDEPHFDINTLDLAKIYSYYQSFGGNGYGILIQVEGVNYHNFKSTYLSICADLGITNTKDNDAIKRSQFNVLSYDPNIYINESSFVFQSVEETNFSDSKKCYGGSVNKKEGKHIPNPHSVFEKIRFDDTQKHLKNDESYITNWDEGYDQVKCWIPIKKLVNGKRYSYLLSYATNLLWLNLTLSTQALIKILQNVNPVAFVNPIDEKQIIKIANSLIKQRNEGKLQPIVNHKKRRVIFNNNCGLTRDEKMLIVHQTQSEHWRTDSTNRIYQIIENWNFSKFGKITQSSISSNYNIGYVTVQKYWSDFKDYVKDLNENYKSNREMKPKEKKDYLSNQTTSSTSIVEINHTITPSPSNVQSAALNEADNVNELSDHNGYFPEADAFEYKIGNNTYTFLNYSILVNQFVDEEQRLIKMQQMLIRENNDNQIIEGANLQFNKFNLLGDVIVEMLIH